MRLVIAAILAAASVAHAQTTWKLATGYRAESFHTQNIARFAEDVAAATQGRLKIEVGANNSLVKLPEIPKAVAEGRVRAGEAIMTGYSASHLSLLGPMMSDLEEAGLVIVGEMPIYVQPANARGSLLIQKLNPPRQYPNVDMNDGVFGDRSTVIPHDVEVGFPLTADEYLTLVRMADFGGQFYSRENAPATPTMPHISAVYRNNRTAATAQALVPLA